MANVGESLRKARLQRGLSIEQAAQDTRITARFITALEDEAYDALPAPVYVRGFLRSYANYLRIDAAALLAELDFGSALAGPDAFVSGPRAPRVAVQRIDPFARDAPSPRPRRPMAPAPVAEDDGFDNEAKDEYDDEEAFVAPVARPRYGAEEVGFRRRAGGPFLHRPGDDHEPGTNKLTLAILGAGVLGVIGIIAAAVALTTGGDGGATTRAGSDDATPGTRTVIAVGSARASASSAAATASGTPGATGTVTVTTTGTPRAGTPTPTGATGATGATASTATPTATTAPPTPTPVPPTPTPVPPTPTPVPIVHPLGFDECIANPESPNDCPNPMRVVCPNDGSGWFVDLPNVGGFFELPLGWRETSVLSELDAKAACGKLA